MDAINWPSIFFMLFAAIACAFGLAVVFASNIVRMAFYLVISLGATAGLFFLAGADFVGAMQLMIYVGGTLVLLIFGVMLTAQGPFISMKTPSGQWVLAAILGSGLLYMLLMTAFDVKQWQPPSRAEAEAIQAPKTATRIGMGLVGVRTDKLQQTDEVLQAGMSSYLLPFEIISIHLLVVLVGAAYLARTKRRRDRVASELPEL
jgi:NADH:ubiquinone oxidoreductase subunit 6 (subunit J)